MGCLLRVLVQGLGHNLPPCRGCRRGVTCDQPSHAGTLHPANSSPGCQWVGSWYRRGHGCRCSPGEQDNAAAPRTLTLTKPTRRANTSWQLLLSLSKQRLRYPKRSKQAQVLGSLYLAPSLTSCPSSPRWEGSREPALQQKSRSDGDSKPMAAVSLAKSQRLP